MGENLRPVQVLRAQLVCMNPLPLAEQKTLPGAAADEKSIRALGQVPVPQPLNGLLINLILPVKGGLSMQQSTFS